MRSSASSACTKGTPGSDGDDTKFQSCGTFSCSVGQDKYLDGSTVVACDQGTGGTTDGPFSSGSAETGTCTTSDCSLTVPTGKYASSACTKGVAGTDGQDTTFQS